VTTVPLDAEATLTLAFTLIPANQFDQAGAMIVVDEVSQSHRLFCSLRAPTRQQWELVLPSESGAIDVLTDRTSKLVWWLAVWVACSLSVPASSPGSAVWVA
jgi:hypothetical protein